MIPQLRRTLQTIGVLHDLNDQHMENLAAMLLIEHYRHSVPGFEERQMYYDELNGIAPLIPALNKHRAEKSAIATKEFRERHIIV